MRHGGDNCDMVKAISKRKFGKGSKPCINCGTANAVIRKYGLNVCRQCFRELARELGFKQYE